MNFIKIISKGFKYVSNKNYRFIVNASLGKYDSMNDKEFLQRKFKAIRGESLNLDNPKTFNEKLQWLKLYNRNPKDTILVDKYKVREYIAKELGEDYLIPLLGVWDNPDDIDFDNLPDKFVLKCNHNSGLGMCICTDKSKLDISKVKLKLKKGLEQDYYLTGREWPYKNVQRKIVCEKYMIDQENNDLRDYKFYCFNGIVKAVMINSDRNSDTETKADYFDKEYNYLDFTWGYPHSNILPNKPKNFDKMVLIAEKISKGYPHIRVDLYDCNNKIYFGEITFFDGSGFDIIEPVSWDYKMGEWIELPCRKN